MLSDVPLYLMFENTSNLYWGWKNSCMGYGNKYRHAYTAYLIIVSWVVSERKKIVYELAFMLWVNSFWVLNHFGSIAHNYYDPPFRFAILSTAFYSLPLNLCLRSLVCVNSLNFSPIHMSGHILWSYFLNVIDVVIHL